MALLFVDSFDHYTAVTDKYSVNASGGRSEAASIVAAVGRRNTAGLKLQNQNIFGLGSGGCIRTYLGANYSQLAMGAAVKFDAGFSQTLNIFEFLDGTTRQMELAVTTTGQLQVERNGTVLHTTAASFTWTVYNYVEWRVTFSNTVGTVEVWFNEVKVVDLTGLDTVNSSNESARTFGLGDPFGPGSGRVAYVDDVYVSDGTIYGDSRVDYLPPSGDGTHTDFTPSTGPTHYTNVDESVPNTGDYVASNVVNSKDSYTLTALDGSVTGVYAVVTNVYMQKDNAGTRQARPFMRSGSSEVGGTSRYLPSDFQYYQDVFPTNPATGTSWTPSEVNSAEAGVEVTG